MFREVMAVGVMHLTIRSRIGPFRTDERKRKCRTSAVKSSKNKQREALSGAILSEGDASLTLEANFQVRSLRPTRRVRVASRMTQLARLGRANRWPGRSAYWGTPAEHRRAREVVGVAESDPKLPPHFSQSHHPIYGMVRPAAYRQYLL